MKANTYTLDINNVRKFLFSRLGTQLFSICLVGCLFFNIMIVKFIHRETTLEGVTADRETFMDDYRDVEGIKVAHRIVQKIEDQVLSNSQVTQVIFNAEEIDASVFQKPE